MSERKTIAFIRMDAPLASAVAREVARLQQERPGTRVTVAGTIREIVAKELLKRGSK